MAQAGIFRELVWHFFGRFFDKESLSPQGEPEAGVIQILGILAPPGGFVALLMSVFNPERWDLVGLRFLFICYSMAAMGVVMVFEWDALFPDKRDYQILTPLPLRVSMLFAARLAALGIFLALFLAAVCSFGVLLWPGVESRGGSYVSVAGTHLTVMVAAGLFAALAIGAIKGLLVTIFRGAWYWRVSVCTQTLIMTLLIMLLCLSPMMGSAVPRLCRARSPFLRCFPAFWFAGLYEQWRPAVPGVAGEEALRGLAPLAGLAIGIAAAVFALTFLPGYRSHARRALEAPEPHPQGPGRAARAWAVGVGRLLRDPVEIGVFHFIGETLVRSLKHRLFLATYGGFGAALVVLMIASGGSSLRVPLMLSFILISGLRAAFNFPSDLRANWAFQVSESSPVAAYVRATRMWVMLCAIVPLFLALAAIEAARAPWTAAAFHFAFGVAVSIMLMEVMFLGFHKVPFTCSHIPGKVNLVFLGVLYCFGFTFYSGWMEAVEIFLRTTPAAAALFFPALAAGWAALGRARREMQGCEAVDYEDDGNPAVRTLGLTGQ
ncbi:MAG TPA: hypothetical protein VG456_15580 [Candidatus Sulfopaludibacter sp.]|jgi:hypothetical protein|nr:hypothetical protein [Candidatus Sulfopaludibacter sp.]